MGEDELFPGKKTTVSVHALFVLYTFFCIFIIALLVMFWFSDRSPQPDLLQQCLAGLNIVESHPGT